MLAVVLVLGMAAAAAPFGVRWLLDRPGPLPDSRDIVVPRGSTAQLGAALTEAGVLTRPLPFELAAWLTWRDGPLRAAEFAFPAHASLRTVLAVLRTGKPVQHMLTIPEGLTSKQIVALVDRAEALTGTTPVPPEGSVLPQTYAYEYGTSRAALLARAQAAMTRALDTAWADRAPNLPIYSPEEALTLASIVERETAKPEERAHVASVYINRLRIGMKLQADPTVVYAASNGLGVLDRKLSRADLERDDPYNTYRVAGLPPGPIAAPGLATLQAVLHPAPSDDLYFVADGSGGHVFAKTLEAHTRNVAAWRALNAPPHPSD